MIIRSMTASFGKLKHDTLTLAPGLNILPAPNEWGKSTWCAFLLAMLYGVDSGQKNTRTALADKNRYAPWSGAPMAGRLTGEQDGTEFTLERSTAGRIPMGSLRCYETASGVPITEWDTETLGEALIGAEKSVYARTGFIRLTDMPVAMDDALRSRLIALVTTGDEDGSGARLAQGLKQLKNRLRYNNSGLLPQARQERSELAERIRELENLRRASDALGAELAQAEEEQRALEARSARLARRAYRLAKDRLAEAEDALARAEEQREELAAACRELPPEEEVHRRREELSALRDDLYALQEQWRSLPIPPPRPHPPAVFEGMDPRRAQAQVREDEARLLAVSGKGWLIPVVLGLLFLAAGAVLWRTMGFAHGLLAAAASLALLVPGLLRHRTLRAERDALAEKYGSEDPEDWHRAADEWTASAESCRAETEAFRKGRKLAEARSAVLKKRLEACCPGGDAPAEMKRLRDAAAVWEQLAQAEEDARDAREHRDALASLIPPAPPAGTDAEGAEIPENGEGPDVPDAGAVRDRLAEVRSRSGALRERLAHYRGRAEQLGDPEELEARLRQLDRRIAALEDTLAAVNLSAETLEQASGELRRRYAPRIAGRAAEFMARLTGGRYDRLTLGDDLSVLAGAQGEDILRDALWRSDGTADQLYLAVRLAAAEALLPGAPLVLDDALVRFDDTRMAAALGLLEELAQSRQILLFSCQSRERRWLESRKETDAHDSGH